jgi:hypothetical protein
MPTFASLAFSFPPIELRDFDKRNPTIEQHADFGF